MTTTKTSDRTSNIHAVISEFTRNKKREKFCGISPEQLNRFKSAAIPIMQKAIQETYKDFPIDARKAAEKFSQYYFTRDRLCLAINPANPIPENAGEIREKIVKKSLMFKRTEIVRSGIVYETFKLETKGSVDPKKSVHYHPAIKPTAVLSSIRELPIPTAMFDSPLPLKTNLQIFSNPNNVPKYTSHSQIRGEKNPKIIRKNEELISIHNIPAFMGYTISYSICTLIGENFNRWTLCNRDNRAFGDLAYNFGGGVYFDINVQRKDIDPTGRYVEKRTLIFMSTAARHKSGFIHWLTKGKFSTIVDTFLQAMLARKLLTHEISSRKALANGRKTN